MTKSEQFAIDEWLFQYPKDASFDDILYLLIDESDETVVPYIDSIPRRDIANFMSGTQTHFAFVTKED